MKYKHIIFKKEIYDERYELEVEKTNVLLVLDNKAEFLKWVPSKLYDAMAIGKPIILFSNNPKSYALKEIEKYDLYHIVNYDDFNTSDIIKLNAFLQENYAKKSSIKFDSIFMLCNKKYLVDKMVDVSNI